MNVLVIRMAKIKQKQIHSNPKRKENELNEDDEKERESTLRLGI